MRRAAVLVSVRKSGNLPELHASERAMAGMKQWANAQQFDIVDVVDDVDGPVEPSHLKKAIKRIVEGGTTDQLVVYFTGHGVNIRQGEYWLLSDAPADTQAAVNVEGSVVLARQSGIPHVVFISDACRTAADGIQAQAVTGSEIFPNDGPSGPEEAVDLFFACLMGRPALEVKNVEATTGSYTAVYTEVLLAALNGAHAAVVEEADDAGARVGVVRPRPLKRVLSDEVGRRLARASVKLAVSQVPDARITSDESVWLSKVPLRAMRGTREPGGRASSVAPPETLLSVSQTTLRTFLSRQAAPLLDRVLVPEEPLVAPFSRAAAAGVDQADLLSRSPVMAAPDFGPAHFETGCGFKVRGAGITGVWSVAAPSIQQLDDSLVRIDRFPGPAANVLLTVDGGAGVLVPAIPHFLAALTFENGELVDIAYEPSDTSPRWLEFQRRMEELRALRGLVAASARFGVLRLEDGDATAIARQMRLANGVDPTTALYTAYAYHDLNRRDGLVDLRDRLDRDLGFRFFDIALLARDLDRTAAGRNADVFPFVPMLAQGWALLSAHRVTLPPRLNGIERRLRSSLWTLFDAAGVDMVRAAMESREVR